MRFSHRLASAALAAVLVAGGCAGGGGGGTSLPDITGVVFERAPGRTHRQGTIDYPGKKPPSGGNHSPSPLKCGYYDTQQPDEFAVHSLEHGAVWIAYDPATDAAGVQTLKAFAALDHVLVMPYAGMDAPITLVAWEHRLEVQTATDPRVQQFVDAYRNGPQAPERGAACAGVGHPTN